MLFSTKESILSKNKIELFKLKAFPKRKLRNLRRKKSLIRHHPKKSQQTLKHLEGRLV